MFKLLVISAVVFLHSASAIAQTAGGFVARLGSDTVFVERYVRSGNTIEGSMVQKFPRATRIHYSVTLDANGRAVSVEHTARAATASSDAPLLLQRKASIADSIVISEIKRNGALDSAGSGRLIVSSGAVPWIANSLAIYEQMIRQAKSSKDDSVAIDQFTWGKQGRAANYVKKVSATKFRAAYSGNPVLIETDASGLILKYDGSQSTAKLLVTRQNDIDIEAVMKRFVVAEAAGGVPGTLSPRDTVRATISGAHLQLDYGRPQRRGRTIWGGLVPWNQVWRTGANAATQFSTDKDLRLGSVTLPAGKYTLWTLPSESGATLIINKQTGQWGTVYDQKQDFARVDMKTEKLSSAVDQFTISLETEGSGGVLKMVWEKTQLSVPFVVQ
jgi:hypothetical protein